MKKKVLAAILAAMALTMSGCGASADFDKANEAEATEVSGEEVDVEIRKAECLAQAEYGDILDTTWEGEPLPPSFIMDDYLSGQQEYADQYYIIRDGYISAVSYLDNGCMYDHDYYPSAMDHDWWTINELVTGYNDGSLPWMEGDVPWRLYLHSSDYRSSFRISDDWLWVNGVKTRPVGNFITLEDVSPEGIFSAYWSGVWDGKVPVYSTDYTTKVTLSRWRGTLEYEYEKVEYFEGWDPLHNAYHPELDPPECIVTGVHEEYDVDQHLALTHDYDDCTRELYVADVSVYMDLPDGKLDTFGDLVYWDYCGVDHGDFIVLPDRIEQYRQGDLVDTWECEVTAKRPHIEQYDGDNNFGDETHLWISDTEIVCLLPGGEMETVLGGLTGEVYGIGEYSLMELSLKDGKLTGYSPICGIVEIAEDVASVDYAWNIALFTGNDGLCYMFFEDDYGNTERAAREAYRSGEPSNSTIEAHCLGEGSWEDYLEAYHAGLLQQIVDNNEPIVTK